MPKSFEQGNGLKNHHLSFMEQEPLSCSLQIYQAGKGHQNVLSLLEHMAGNDGFGALYCFTKLGTVCVVISDEESELRGCYRESLQELRTLLRRQSRPLQKRRLRFLELLKSGQCSSQAQAGALIGLKPRASEKLWKLYTDQGIEGLLRPRGGGHPPKLTEEAKADLQTQLDESRVATLKEACLFVAQNHGISLTTTAMHYYFKGQKIKKKTGRPTHVHKDREGEEAFKKKSSRS